MFIKLFLKSLLLFFFCLMFSLNSKAANVSSNNIDTSHMSVRDSTRIAQIEKRVSEIQSMDLSSLSPSEKKSLRKELVSMEQETRHYTVVYISVGTVLIVILILILILH